MAEKFETPEDCVHELERKLSHEPMRFSGRSGAGRQLRCEKCRRWKYVDERCNLFETRTAQKGEGVYA